MVEEKNKFEAIRVATPIIRFDYDNGHKPWGGGLSTREIYKMGLPDAVAPRMYGGVFAYQRAA